jgi:glycerophosphoryl diester phosphodiesterase
MNALLDLDARPVIAHRGASGLAPENTLDAFDLAAKGGADAFELDVRLSRDGAPVVIHDAVLDRTTDRTGPVRAYTVAELRMADAGFHFTTDRGNTFPFRGSSARIPTLGEVLWTFPGMPMLIEVKEPEVQAAVQRVLVNEGATERCVLASEHQEALELFTGPPFTRAASGPEISALYRSVLFHLPLPRVNYAAARSLGCPVDVWTVNETATARALWARGVAGIVTDLPDRMLAGRSSAG